LRYSLAFHQLPVGILRLPFPVSLHRKILGLPITSSFRLLERLVPSCEKHYFPKTFSLIPTSSHYVTWQVLPIMTFRALLL
jgi:hypothetical protein